MPWTSWPRPTGCKAQGHPVISMAVGQPSDPAPEAVREAARQALCGGQDRLHGHARHRRIAPAPSRCTTADHYGLDVPAARIAVTTGSSAAFNLAFLAMFDPGDRVAIASPGYPAYRNIMAALGLEVVEIELDGAAYLHAGHLRDAHAQKPLKGVLFASPANPTGAVMPATELRALIETARELGIAVISDEIYHRLTYAGADVTALGYRRRRDGDQLVLEILLHDRLADRLDGFARRAGAAGRAHRAEPLHLGAGTVADRGGRGLRRDGGAGGGQGALCAEPRTADASGCRSSALRSPRRWTAPSTPICDVSKLTNDSMEFARRMLAEAHVAATPGRDFDPLAGHRTMRFSYAGSHDDMEMALERIGAG